MSQTNPRKAVLRTPNGSGAETPQDASHQPTVLPQPINHPLPQHPHTHIPAHLKNAPTNPRSHHHHANKPRQTSSPAPVDESPDVKAQRQKYSTQLTALKEIYPNWSDLDLLTVLSECSGNADVAFARIAEGRAEQWDSVSRTKKDKKDKPSAQSFARDRTESGGSASPGPARGSGSGFRGGRGGLPAGAGRGGRGGFTGRGGRGGANGAGFGKVPLGPDSSASPAPDAAANGDDGWGAVATDTSKGAWGAADTSKNAWGTTSDAVKSVWGTTNDDSSSGWGSSAHKEPANGTSHKETPVAPTPTPSKPQSIARPIAKPIAKPVPTPGKLSWAQVAKTKAKPIPSPVPVSQPAPIAAPATSSAAQDNVPAPEHPTSDPENTSGTTQSLEDEPAHEESTALDTSLEPTSADPPVEESSWGETTSAAAHTAPTDDWIVLTPQDEKTRVELPAPIHAPEPEPVVVEPPVVEKPEPVPEPVEPTPMAPPPGLSAVPTPAPAPAPAPVAKPSTPKPSTPRLASHRASAKYKTSDAPVVMPGGGLPTTVFGGLSFGNAITGSVVPSFGGIDTSASRFGMQFGSLNLNDDLDSSAPVEPPAPALEPAPVEPTPAPQEPQVIAPPEPEPIAAPQPVPIVTQPPQPQQQPQLQAQPQVAPQQSPRVSSHINNLFQQADRQQQQQQQQQLSTPQPQSLPHQVTAPSQAPAPQQPPPLKVDSLPPFGGLQGAPGLMNHLQQSHLNPSPSHLQSHLSQQQHAPVPSPTQQQPQQQYPNHQPQAQLPPHLDTTPSHPAIAAQNQYFRGADSPYLLAPTPQSQIPQQPTDHSSPYGAFAALGQQQQSQLGGFGTSPAAGNDYGGYDNQSRAFYDYQQSSSFQNRNQLGHEEPTKAGLPSTNPSSVLPGQQGAGIGPGQPGPQSGLANQQAQYGMLPYHYPQQFYPQHVPTHPGYYNPYSAAAPNPYKYPPYSQPPPGPNGPGPQQSAKPQAGAAGSPYGNFPSQSTPYDDPSSVAGSYQQAANPANDYQKQQQQQQPLYGQNLQNFFNQNSVQGGAGGPQGQRSAGGATSTSPENAYKQYAGAPGVGGADKPGPQQGQGRAAGPGGPQPQQGGYFPNRYSGQPQPTSGGYPGNDGQQYYPSYQQPRQYW